MDSEYGQRLLVLIPFTAKDLDKLGENVDRWPSLPATRGHPDIRPFVHLLFYSNVDLVSQGGPAWQQFEALRRRVEGWRIFGQVNYLSAHIEPVLDRYPGGATEMFFEALTIPHIRDTYAFLFWMEPDCFPVRQGWLDRLYHLATMSGTHYWVLGSILRARPSPEYAKISRHINGNALYRLNDPEFDAFLALVQHEYAQRKGQFLRSFDVAIHLVGEQLEPYEVRASVAHHFVYTDVIMNVYRRGTSMSEVCAENPRTFFLHGRHLNP